jgi:hypothetical protein
MLKFLVGQISLGMKGSGVNLVLPVWAGFMAHLEGHYASLYPARLQVVVTLF